MDISFIVLTYNRPDALHAVLHALAAQCSAQDQIIVADDGSRAECVQALIGHAPRFPCPALHVWHEDRGFTAAAARNRAALEARAPYLVFIDGDCVPGPHFVARHRQLAQRACFVNGSRVLLDPQLTRFVLDARIDLSQVGPAFWLRSWLQGRVNKVHHLLPWPSAWRRIHRSFSWRGIRSCNFGLWRDDFFAVNGFDQIFQGWGHEDADLVLRLHHAGLGRKNGFLATEVFHLWHPENARAQEGDNRARVIQRQGLGTIRAKEGLAELRASDGQVTPL